MRDIDLIFHYPNWYLLLCFLASILFSTILYAKKGPWPKGVRWMLMAFRSLVFFILFLLLLNPFLRSNTNFVKKPLVALGIDNSSSITLQDPDSIGNALRKSFIGIEQQLKEQGFDVIKSTLNGRLESIDSVRFDHNSSDLFSIVKNIDQQSKNQPPNSTILFTDGISNRGNSLAYAQYDYKIFTLGLGDTSIQRDVFITGLEYNKLVYQENKFPLVVKIGANGFAGQQRKIVISSKGKIVAERKITFSSNQAFQKEKFIINSPNNGVQRYQVTIPATEQEHLIANNTANAFVEVINTKQKILIMAPAPHPDIKALALTIEKNKNYEIHYYLRSANQKLPTTKFDLVIWHHAFDARNSLTKAYRKLKENENTSFLYVLGRQTSVRNLKDDIKYFTLRPRAGKTDQITADINPKFKVFKTTINQYDLLREAPPVRVPYGDYQVQNHNDVLLYQKIGSVVTKRPYIMVNNQNRKTAVIFGNGFWTWRMHEIAESGGPKAFQEVFGKLIQYLSTREDKRRFKAYSTKKEYSENESIIIKTECYNKIYEPIYGQEISLSFTNQESNITNTKNLITSEDHSSFTINNLASGVYDFVASTKLDGKTKIVKGQFRVARLNLEALNVQAKHNLLKQISQENGGKFFHHSKLSDLTNEIRNWEAIPTIHSEKRYKKLIDYEWLVAVLILLLSLEWVARKYFGSY